MFVAWRDLRSARGRFVLVGAVVALLTVLVGFLAGLAGGLAERNISAVLDLPGDRLILETPDRGSSSFSQSVLDPAAVAAWRDAPGVTAAISVGIVQGRATGDDGPVAAALIGIPTDADPTALTVLAPRSDAEVGLSRGAAADLGVAEGDRVVIAESTYRVTAVGDDVWYSHTPVVAMTPAAWAGVDRALGGDGSPTVLAVSGTPDWDGLARTTGTSASTPLASLSALETFRSEIGSLGLMIVMLFGISALVIGAFFTVWTLQRTSDIAVLKALGATTGSLVLDALGQATVVLALGIGAGMLAVVGLGALAGSALPFMLSPLTTLLPAVVLAGLGLLGTAVAIRPVASADPLTALGSNR